MPQVDHRTHGRTDFLETLKLVALAGARLPFGVPDPVLSGAAAVELYTGGLWSSGDLEVLAADARALTAELFAVGFRWSRRPLRKRGVAVRNLDDLASRLERVTDYDKARQELNEAQSALAEARAAASTSAHEADALRARLDRIPASQVQMADKAAQKDAMSAMLSRAGVPSGTDQERLQAVLAQASKREKTNSDLTGQNEQMRREIARVKGNGGSGLPYCWATFNGHPEYMLRVDLHDDNVVVNDISPRPRPGDPAWQMLAAVPRGQTISIATLISEVAPLDRDAAAKKCRYAVEAFDGTGRTNKVGYKYLMGRPWSVFMVREIR